MKFLISIILLMSLTSQADVFKNFIRSPECPLPQHSSLEDNYKLQLARILFEEMAIQFKKANIIIQAKDMRITDLRLMYSPQKLSHQIRPHMIVKTPQKIYEFDLILEDPFDRIHPDLAYPIKMMNGVILPIYYRNSLGEETKQGCGFRLFFSGKDNDQSTSELYVSLVNSQTGNVASSFVLGSYKLISVFE